MGYQDHIEIVTEEQAIRWLEELTTKVEQIRLHLDFQETQTGRRADIHQSEYRQMLIHYGIAVGAMEALAHCRKVSEVAYDGLKARATTSMQSKVLVAP